MWRRVEGPNLTKVRHSARRRPTTSRRINGSPPSWIRPAQCNGAQPNATGSVSDASII